MIRKFVQKAIDKIASAESEIALCMIMNGLTDEEANALAKAIKVTKHPVTLDLRSNSIGDAGAKALAGAIAEASVPVTLDLGDNGIGDQVVKDLADAIKVVKHPINLNLWNNNVGDEGAKALAGAIAVAIVPINLNLWNNNIGAEGAKDLAGAIVVAIVPINLNLGYNNIRNEGARDLAEAIKKAKHTVTLTFFKNDMGDEEAQALRQALRINEIKFKEHPVNSIKEFLSKVTFQGNLVNAIANYKVPEITEEKIQQYIDGSMEFNAIVSKEQATQILARTLFETKIAPFSAIPLEIRELILSKIKDGKYLENLVLQVYKEIKDANPNATAVGEGSDSKEKTEVATTDDDNAPDSGGGDAKKPSDSLSAGSRAEDQEYSNATNILCAEAPKELILRLVDTVEELSGKEKEYEESIQELEELQEKLYANITFSQFPELDIPEKYVDTQHVLGGMVAVGSHFA